MSPRTGIPVATLLWSILAAAGLDVFTTGQLLDTLRDVALNRRR